MRTPEPGIDPGVSSYIDALRILAAATVLLSHYGPKLFALPPDLVPGHDAVIVFFVLSGYVIAHVAQAPGLTLTEFAIHRLARLWSVLLPALCLGAVVYALVSNRTILAAAPAMPNLADFLSASGKNAIFLGESWFGATFAPYNAPVWSLNYEAWYYAIFAAWRFAPHRLRWISAAAIALLAGPRVLLLLPCWLLGAALYYHQHRLRLRPLAAYALYALCATLYALAWHANLTAESRTWIATLTHGKSYYLRGSTSCLGDTLLAPLVAASILAVRWMPAIHRALSRARPLARAAASRTLSIYLFHIPLFVLLYGWLGIGRDTNAGASLCLALGVAGAISLGSITEARLPAWRRSLRRAIRQN